MAKFSSPPAGPLAAGLESDFCRCRLEVLHVFQNFTLVQVFTPAHAVSVTVVTVVQRSASRKCQKPRVKPENTCGVFQVFSRVLPALDAGDRRGSLPGLAYRCSAGLTLATVVGKPHCCSVVTVNTSNTVFSSQR